MSNREKRSELTSLHLYLALARNCQGEHPDCIRQVIKWNYNELGILIAELEAIGGYWRIYKTVNARDVDKARKWLLKDLIDHPEHGSYIDSQWRTALLQKDCRATNYFMLDIDTQEEDKIAEIESKIPNELISVDGINDIFASCPIVIDRIKSPKGWHYITSAFDTREVCKLPYVTLLRDGYHFVCEVGTNSLIETNKYLRQPNYKEVLKQNIITSSAVEGVIITEDML